MRESVCEGEEGRGEGCMRRLEEGEKEERGSEGGREREKLLMLR